MTQHHMFDYSYQYIVNVSKVPHRSPFRYPGGKTWIVPRVRQWLASLPSRPACFVEPFCGGAIVGLSVAFEQLADQVVLMELDPAVAAVWETVINGSAHDVAWLCHRIRTFQMSAEHVDAAIEESGKSQAHRAFATLLRNRTNHAGGLAKGTGRLKYGEHGKGLLSRWYPDTLADRITAIALLQRTHNNLVFQQGDGFTAFDSYGSRPDVAWFIDPPYVKAGKRLYDYNEIDNRALLQHAAAAAGSIVVTYDDAPEIAQIAHDYNLDTQRIPMQNKNHTVQRELLIGHTLDWARS